MKGKTGFRTGSINGLTGVIGLPEARARWSLRLLLDRMVSLDYVDSLSHEKVQQVSKKESKPWQRKQWSIAPKNHAEFVCIMEDILSVYQQYFSAQFPLVCTNESS